MKNETQLTEEEVLRKQTMRRRCFFVLVALDLLLIAVFVIQLLVIFLPR